MVQDCAHLSIVQGGAVQAQSSFAAKAPPAYARAAHVVRKVDAGNVSRGEHCVKSQAQRDERVGAEAHDAEDGA